MCMQSGLWEKIKYPVLIAGSVMQVQEERKDLEPMLFHALFIDL